MAVQSLLAFDLKKLVQIIVKRISREIPELGTPDKVLEVSLIPELDLLYIRFERGEKEGYGEYIGEYIHVFHDEKHVLAVEITPFSKFLRKARIEG